MSGIDVIIPGVEVERKSGRVRQSLQSQDSRKPTRTMVDADRT